MKIIKLETHYTIEDNNHLISVIVHKDTLSIFRYSYFNENFEFILSSPETIKAIAKLLIEATKLIEK